MALVRKVVEGFEPILHDPFWSTQWPHQGSRVCFGCAFDRIHTLPGRVIDLDGGPYRYQELITLLVCNDYTCQGTLKQLVFDFKVAESNED